MYEVKQSTALTLPFFVHDVSGDAVTGLVDAGFTKRISKNGAAFAAMTVTITEMENGWYSIPLSVAHSDTLGLLTIVFTHGSSKQINLQFRVEAKLIDDLNDISNPVTVGTINANAINAAAVAASALDGKGDWNIGKTGYALSAAGIDSIIDETLTSHVTADSLGVAIKDILADTADIQPKLGTPAADVSADIAAIKAETALIVADTNELQTDDVPGLIAALNDLSAAQVNAEVLDVMNVDTITLPGQVAPPLTPTHREAIGHLYKAYRNRKTQTATQWSLMADDETTVDQKATVSDDATTAIKQEIVAGP